MPLADPKALNPRAHEALNALLEGNRRFQTGRNNHVRYDQDSRLEMVQGQRPIAAIVSCVDSRVTPEILFDQPLGSIFVSRVPANVASDSAKWMIEIAVGEFHVPLLMVLGHSGCLALKQVLDGKSGPGGLLRFRVQAAVHRAQMDAPTDLYGAAIRHNAKQTIADLRQESWTLQHALENGSTSAVAAVYDIRTGGIEFVD